MMSVLLNSTTQDYIRYYSSDPNLMPFSTWQNAAMTVWIKHSYNTAAQAILMLRDATNNSQTAERIYLGTAGGTAANVAVGVYDNSTLSALTPDTFPTYNQGWVFLGLSMGSDNYIKYYWRSSNDYYYLRANWGVNRTPDSLRRIIIGYDPYYSRYFNGRIAEVALWNQDLSESTLEMLSNGFNPTSLPGLASYYPFRSSLSQDYGDKKINLNNDAFYLQGQPILDPDHPRIYQ